MTQEEIDREAAKDAALDKRFKAIEDRLEKLENPGKDEAKVAETPAEPAAE